MPITHALAPSHRLSHNPADARGLPALVATSATDNYPVPLPLKSLTVRATISATTCTTTVLQTFSNPTPTPTPTPSTAATAPAPIPTPAPAPALNATYIFPLPVDAAVTRMELRAGASTTVAECRERESATRDFDAARDRGHAAAIMTAQRPDVHTMRVANIPPGEDVQALVHLSQVLPVVDGRVEWRFPTVVAPRYMPGAPVGKTGDGAVPDTTLVPDASRIAPPLRIDGSGAVLDLEVTLEASATRLESSLHAIRVDLDDGTLKIAPAGTASLDRDFILAFTTAHNRDDNHSTTRAVSHGEYTLITLTPPARAAAHRVAPRDAVLVLDTSGSMSGRKLRAAKLAVRSALHALTAADRFKLIAFSSTPTAFSAEFAACTDAAVADAERWLDGRAAGGGTEMLAPIVAALQGDTPPGRARTVLFVTDGQAGNEQQLMAAVAGRSGGAVFCTLGIDTAVNEALLRALAGVGGGTCKLCTPDDDIESVMASLDGGLGSPILRNVQVGDAGGGALDLAAPAPSTVFLGSPLTLFAHSTPTSVTVTAESVDGQWTQTCRVESTNVSLAALWAKRRISHLQERILMKPFEDEALRPDIIRLSTEFNVLSNYTALLAVDQSLRVVGERIDAVQPAEVPHRWAGVFGASASAAGFGAGAPKPSPPARQRFSVFRAIDEESGRAGFRCRAGPPEAPGLAIPSIGADTLVEDHPALPPAPSSAVVGQPSETVTRKRIERSQKKPAQLRGGSWGTSGIASEDQARQSKDGDGPPKLKDIPGALSRAQRVNGSFGDGAARTAAAVLRLVLLGHNREVGACRRTVEKGTAFLLSAGGQDGAAAVKWVDAAESGSLPPRGEVDAEWEAVARAAAGSFEGECLERAMKDWRGVSST